MKKIIMSIAIVGFSLVSSFSYAEYISAWGETISSAEEKIKEKAKGQDYVITSVRMGDYAYITANVSK